VLEYDGESEGQLRAREKRNRLKEGHRHRARQQKEAHNTYRMELVEYYKGRLEKEAKERRATRAHETPYNKIREALEELEAILHPNEEQERLQEVLWTTTQKVHGGRTPSGFPSRTTSHEQDAQSQRRSAFERLGPNESQNRERRRDNNQSNQIEHPREEGSRTSHHSPPRFIPRTNNN
jgi:hypothetical protein